MKRSSPTGQRDVPPTIKGILRFIRGLRILANSLKTWWPGTELNRRRQPFQGCALPAELPGHARGCAGNGCYNSIITTSSLLRLTSRKPGKTSHPKKPPPSTVLISFVEPADLPSASAAAFLTSGSSHAPILCPAQLETLATFPAPASPRPSPPPPIPAT